jgi:hypothetical protein
LTVKRFTGWILALTGGVAAAWGAVSVMTGASATRLNVTSDLSVDAMTTGLAGLAVLTIGLVWIRD